MPVYPDPTKRQATMSQSNTFIVAEEGWACLVLLLGIFAFFTLIDAELLQLLSFAAFIGAVYLYRNPERAVPYYQPNSIVAVSDGTVTSIETVEATENDDTPCYKIEIDSGYKDAALLRAPFESHVEHIDIRRGSRLSVSKPLAAKLNEKAVIRFVDGAGNRVTAEHLLVQSLDVISLRAHVEQRVIQGGRYGLLLKGKHTLYLPARSRVAVKVGDNVRAGESLIGYFS